MKDISFIGLGIMGKPMVRNLMRAGFALHIYARHPEKVQDVVQEGAIFHGTIADCVTAGQVVITMVGYPRDVEEVYFSPNGILSAALPGGYLVDMTTTSPALAQRIAQEGEAKGLHVLDAPVTGGDTGAKAGTLSILVGGRRADFDACTPILRAMGSRLTYMGKAGNGQQAKLANQIMVAANMAGLCEAIAFGTAKGLDLEVLLEALSVGAAGSRQLDCFASKILAGDYAPGFFLKHLVKDMSLVAEEAERSGVHLDVLQQVLSNYQRLEAAGCGDLGTQALIQYYEAR